jgi:hypothetical protein
MSIFSRKYIICEKIDCNLSFIALKVPIFYLIAIGTKKFILFNKRVMNYKCFIEHNILILFQAFVHHSQSLSPGGVFMIKSTSFNLETHILTHLASLVNVILNYHI